MINSKIELINYIKNNKKVYFYGAGKVCESIISFLKNNYQCDGVQAILVSKGHIDDRYRIYGYEIIEADDIKVNTNIPVLVTTRKKLFEEIDISLKKIGFKNITYLHDSLSVSLIDEMYWSRPALIDDVYNIRNQLLRFIPRPCIEYMVLNILDHCNLRCKGCDHFACIADPYFVPFETIYNDLERLSSILKGDSILRIAVMGGEPLLHPDLLQILPAVRKFFPYTKIRLTTNGLLLLNQNDEFWNVCRENNVIIVNTKYPININHNKIKEKADFENVQFMYFEGTGDEVIKEIFKKIIDPFGDNDPVISFAECHISNYGNCLMEGRLYPCPFSCQSNRIFNKKFNQNLRLTENDYLDIYKVNDLQEILDFAAKPKPYCRYCKGLKTGLKWERTSGNIYEWLDENVQLS